MHGAMKPAGRIRGGNGMGRSYGRRLPGTSNI